MEKKIRLRLYLKLFRAVIDVLETELDRQIERMQHENWMENRSENFNLSSRGISNFDASKG